MGRLGPLAGCRFPTLPLSPLDLSPSDSLPFYEVERPNDTGKGIGRVRAEHMGVQGVHCVLCTLCFRNRGVRDIFEPEGVR